jgi:hypothetical protein
MATEIRNNSYFIIHGWMITELNLKGLERDIYAIIYGFSRDGKGVFNGGAKYLADFTNSSERGVQKAITSLVEQSLIDKKVVAGKATVYTAIPPNSVHMTPELSSPPSINNNINNITKKKDKKENLYSRCSEIVESKFTDPDIKTELYKYLKFRITVGLNAEQWEDITENLFTIATTKEEVLQIIDASYQNNWRSFFPLKKTYSKKGYQDNIIKTEKTDEGKLRDLYREEFSMIPVKDRPSFDTWLQKYLEQGEQT